jgi:pyruvate/2-oxoglutarate dehydrogenase complex dihydrolipoamide acyltransferase (E2) component
MAVVPVIVPTVGESISEGTLARWLKPDGAMVQAGEALFELETDKASSNVPAPGSGVLKIAVAEGQTVAVGATVAATARRPRRHRQDQRPPRPQRHNQLRQLRLPSRAARPAQSRVTAPLVPAGRYRRLSGGWFLKKASMSPA